MKKNVTLFLCLFFMASFNVFGQNNTALGTYAGNDENGSDNVAVGFAAGDVVTGSGNTFVGSWAGPANTSGTRNVFLGFGTGRFTTTASYNVFVGADAGYKNTLGVSNTFLGNGAGYSNTSGQLNVYVGDGSGGNNLIGSRNTFFGVGAGGYSKASDNAFFGYSAGRSLTTGTKNSFFGPMAGYNSGAGSNNTILGGEAGYNVGSGANNIFIGYQAGYNEAGSNKLYIENSQSATPLVYGDFAMNQLGINTLPVSGYTLSVGGPINANGPINATAVYVNGANIAGDLSYWTKSGSNIFNLTDNFGIGKDNPTQKLDVNGVVNASGFLINGQPFAGGGSQWATQSSGTSIYYNAGNVGIGTATPEAAGKLTIDAGVNDNAKQGIYVKSAAGTNSAGPALILDNTATWEQGRSFIRGVSRTIDTQVYTDIVLYKGLVGINTNYPDATLTVNGKVHAKEVRIDLNIAGPDYVFETTYDLRTLEEVKNYIDANKHLPEIPAAAVMEKNGVELGEMNMLLLKKVEELTLYNIQQNEELKTQKEVIRLLEERLGKLESAAK